MADRLVGGVKAGSDGRGAGGQRRRKRVRCGRCGVVVRDGWERCQVCGWRDGASGCGLVVGVLVVVLVIALVVLALWLRLG